MKIQEILSKYHNYLLVIAVVISSIAISIRGSDGEVRLVLQDYPAIITILISISLFLVALYFKINSKIILNLSQTILEQSKDSNDEFNSNLDDLTERQKEVYDLIILGKSNKEIMNELFIEHGTLKTHINQIYKKLNIKNRRDLKSKSKS